MDTKKSRTVECYDIPNGSRIMISFNSLATWNRMIDDELRTLANALKNIVDATGVFDPPLVVDALVFSVDARANVLVGKAKINKISIVKTFNLNSKSSSYVYDVYPKIDPSLAEAIFTNVKSIEQIWIAVKDYYRNNKAKLRANDRLYSYRVHNSEWSVDDEKKNFNESNTKNKKENMKKKNVNEEQMKSFSGLDLSKITGTVAEILTTNFERFNACRTFEDVVALCHELFDDAKLDTEWTRKFFYNLDQIRQQNPNPRRAFEKAMLFMNNARMKGAGMGMERGTRRFYEEGEEDENLGESATKENKSPAKKQYTKKQIMESIKYWQKQLDIGNYKA